MTELILIRHGETDWNRERRFQGHIDIPLNARGRQQARLLGERLRGTRIDAIYCSDLGRAHETATGIVSGAGIDLPLVPTPALRERSYGLFEGLTVAEIEARHPSEFAEWRRHDIDFAVAGAESARSFHDRIIPAVRELVLCHAGRTLMLVTHGGVLDMIYRSAQGIALTVSRPCPIRNCAFNRVRVHADGRFEIVTWAEEEHLTQLDARTTDQSTA